MWWGTLDTYLSLNVVEVTLHDAVVLVGHFNLENAGFVGRAIGCGISQSVGLPESPK